MDNRVFDKTKPFTRPVTDGAARPQFFLTKTLVDNGFLQGGGPNITGCTVNQNLRKLVWNSDQDVISPAGQPITTAGGGGLWERLAPEGALVKGAGVPEAELNFGGLALCFDGEGEGSAAVTSHRYAKGCVFAVPYVETPAGPGTGEMLSAATLSSQGMGPGVGGMMEIDAVKGMTVRQMADAERGKRKKDWQSHKTNFSSGALWGYAQMFGPAVTGAVAHPGAAGESNADADV